MPDFGSWWDDPPPKWPETVVDRILQIRDDPPKKLDRTPGPLTILYYLTQDQDLHEAGVVLPRSTRTIWKILDRHHRILRPSATFHDPEERPAPGVEWGMDFHDVSCVSADPRWQATTCCGDPECGRSWLIGCGGLGNSLANHSGRPSRTRLSRSYPPGSRSTLGWQLDSQGLSFPSVALPAMFGDRTQGLPAADTREKPFVERYHRNFKYECQLIEQPHDLAQTREVNQPYVHFYNYERPNQAITCGNQPPLMKFPRSPWLSPVPNTVDPDRWLSLQTGKTYMRRLDRNGSFQLGNQTYYVQQKLRGRSVTIWIDGRQKELDIYVDRQVFNKIPIKGLQNRLMDFPAYLELICQEAISTWRRILRRTPTYRRVTM